MTVLCTRTTTIMPPYKPRAGEVQRVKVDGTVESCTQARRDRPEPEHLQFEEPEPDLFRRCHQSYYDSGHGDSQPRPSWQVFELWYEES